MKLLWLLHRPHFENWESEMSFILALWMQVLNKLTRYTKWPWGRAQVSFQWETRDDSLIFFCLIRAGGTVRTHCGQWWLSEIRISTEGSWTSRRSHQGTPKTRGGQAAAAPRRTQQRAEALLQQRFRGPPRPVQEGFLLRTGEPSWRRDAAERRGLGRWKIHHCKQRRSVLSSPEGVLARKGSSHGSTLEEAWHPTPGFLPGESHRHRSPWAAVHGVARVGYDLATRSREDTGFLQKGKTWTDTLPSLYFLPFYFLSCSNVSHMDVQFLSTVKKKGESP